MRRALAAAAPYAVFFLLAGISWQRWIEPYVDTGRELMVPARVAAGERLYRDVRFYYGPLAPWIAAGVEKASGRSLPARVWLAGAVALAHIEALRRLTRRLLDPLPAAVVVALAIAVAFFLPPGGTHLFPYSVDTAMAVAAVTWALVLAAGLPKGGRSDRGERSAGVCLFAALLARPEYGLAAAAALCLDSPAWPRTRRLLLLPASAAGLVYVIASAGTPLETLRTEGWLAFLFSPPEFRHVYSSFAGFDRLGLRLAELALAAILIALVGALLLAGGFAAARAGDRRGRTAAARSKAEAEPEPEADADPRRKGARTAAVLVVAAILAAAGATVFRPPSSLEATVGLLPPLVRVAPPFVAVLALLRAAERLGLRPRRRSLAPLLADLPDGVLYLAGLFSARVLFAAGYVGPYPAFFLPLVLVTAGAALFRLASRADRSLEPEGGVAPVRSLLVAALVVFLAFRVADRTRRFRTGDWKRLETPAGALELAEPLASPTQAALEALARMVPPGRPVAGFPEPGFFQYTRGYSSPLAADQFFPGHLDARAEAETVARLTARPPDAIVLANVVTVGHGPLAFGSDYLAQLGAALDRDFAPVVSFGPGARAGARIGDPDFFVEIRVPRRRIEGKGSGR